VIYYFYDEENPLYAIFLYGKNEQANLTPQQKARWRRLPRRSRRSKSAEDQTMKLENVADELVEAMREAGGDCSG